MRKEAAGMPDIVYPLPGMGGPLWQRDLSERFLTWYSTRRSMRRIQNIEQRATLSFVDPSGDGRDTHRALAAGDLPLVFICHNDLRFLRSFLAHYRQLGVTRFICVDDGSTDGSVEYLLSQADVDLWSSPLRYRDARRGKNWREELFSIYGAGRWYLSVDSDEYLVYEDCFEKPLPVLIARLEALSITRLAAPMIDLYPSGDVEDADFNGRDDRMPWQVADSYDGDGYTVMRNARFVRIRGGVRARLFGSNADLTKYPLMFWDGECSLGENIHQPLPYDRNFVPMLGVLLHFKFFSDFQARVQQAVEEGQHANGASEYRKILKEIDGQGLHSFAYEGSRRFDGPDELVSQGFIASPFATHPQ
jgi:hypothetical protein